MELRKEILDINVNALGDISVSYVNNVYELNAKIANGEKCRRAFVPGEFQALAEWVNGAETAANVISAASAIWTQEVVDAYQAVLAQNESVNV